MLRCPTWTWLRGLRQAAERYRLEGAERHDVEYGQKLAARFRDEFKRALASILERPNQWSFYLHGTRRVILRVFPFSIVYLVLEDGSVFIVAVSHHSREPGYWKTRPRKPAASRPTRR
jgi:toxin ParE1/3/4